MQFKQQGLKSYRSKKEFLKEIIFTKLHDSWMNTEHYKNSQFLKNIISLFLGSVNPLLTTKISAFGPALGLCLFEVTQGCQTTIQFLLNNTHTKPPSTPTKSPPQNILLGFFSLGQCRLYYICYYNVPITIFSNKQP